MSSQRIKFLILLLIGLFLSVCLAILINSISLPSWLRPLVPVFFIALVALLILVEALKEDTPTPQGRRDFIKHFVVPASWITLLTILGGFLTIEEAHVETEREQLAKAQRRLMHKERVSYTNFGLASFPLAMIQEGYLTLAHWTII